MKENRATLITILVLLAIFGSITMFGTLVGLKEKISESNPNHEFYFNNKLYFYDEDDKLLGTYECQTDSCGYIKTIIDDGKYGIDYYKDGTSDELKRVNNEYAYIQDGEKIVQYSFDSAKAVLELSAFKNYKTNIDNDIVFFQKKDKWGVFSLKDNMIINYGYSFIGLKNDIDNGILKTNRYIVLKDNQWFILDNKFETISSPLTKTIKSYTDEYIICTDNTIYDFTGIEVVGIDRFKEIRTIDNYIVGITNANIAIVYINPQTEAVGFTNLGEYTNLDIKFNNNMMEFYNNDTLIQSVALS